MDVPIHVENGDTTVVRFEGCGLRAPELSYTNLSSSSESVVSEQSMLKRPFPGQVRSLPDPESFMSKFSAQRVSRIGLFYRAEVCASHVSVCSWSSCPRTASLLATSLFAPDRPDSSS